MKRMNVRSAGDNSSAGARVGVELRAKAEVEDGGARFRSELIDEVVEGHELNARKVYVGTQSHANSSTKSEPFLFELAIVAMRLHGRDGGEKWERGKGVLPPTWVRDAFGFRWRDEAF